MHKQTVTECQLAETVVAGLREEGYDIYQEVVACGGRIADIVAVKGLLVHVIECKTSLNMAVLGQALYWLPYANMVSVAFPYHVKGHTRDAYDYIFDHSGIGAIRSLHGTQPIEWLICPKLRRTALTKRILDCLDPGQKISAKAGTSKGGRWTPFRQTCIDLRRYVQDNPGCLLVDAMRAIKHHYKTDYSARSSMADMLRRGIVEGVEIRGETKRWTLFPSGWAE